MTGTNHFWYAKAYSFMVPFCTLFFSAGAASLAAVEGK